jgi:deoxyribodipyrimidine photo-lyase
MRLICWFRRDLRLSDNIALDFAARSSAGAVIPLFIFDDAILKHASTGPAITAAMLEMLAGLDASLRALGSELIIRHGEPLAELQALIAATGADGVVWNRDYLPDAVRRDRAVKASLRAAGKLARSFHDAVLVEPEGLLTQAAGRPYAVYGAYARRWGELAYAQAERSVAAPARLELLPEALPRQPLPSLDELGFRLTQRLPPASEAAAQALLDQFFADRPSAAIQYGQARDLPAEPGTSQLSLHLRMGTISPRACLRAALAALTAPLTAAERAGVDTWLGELAWRDFYTQLAFHVPHVLEGPYDPRFAAIEWRNDEAEFAAWRAGRTGYPIVDAGQRQLLAEAWMHNRVRMISASFLVKHLLIDWRWGERYFMTQLRDAEQAANNGGWQWAAGTGGPSAQPYFRILNPTAQGKKHDPQGRYVRRYLPELARVPDRYIHEPWLMPPALQEHIGCRIGVDYPAPLVDHAAARDRALAAYRAAARPDGDDPA